MGEKNGENWRIKRKMGSCANFFGEKMGEIVKKNRHKIGKIGRKIGIF
jgi:hypothetical protein